MPFESGYRYIGSNLPICMYLPGQYYVKLFLLSLNWYYRLKYCYGLKIMIKKKAQIIRFAVSLVSII